jgi:hypothetical protein
MRNSNPFVLLKNPSGKEEKFNKVRLFKPPVKEEEEVDKTPKPFHQQRLETAYRVFNIDRRRRINSRNLELPAHVDLIKIHFFVRFNKDLQKKFYKKYGLRVVLLEDFNQTVLFAIDDEGDFSIFKRHLQDFFESKPGRPYEGKPYALIALIQQFHFLSSTRRNNSFSPELSSLSLIPLADKNTRTIHESLIAYLRRKNKPFVEEESLTTIEVSGLSANDITEILNNFDIVKAVTSVKTAKVRPGDFGDVIREYGFEVTDDENNITVGIIDTGINQIDPLRSLLSSTAFDITGHGAPFWDENGHGTMVAGLVGLGHEFLITDKDQYTGKAKLAVIKVLQEANGTFSVNRMVQVIREAATRHGIRLFNLSLNDPIPKKYNATHSDYAYALDRLAHELDILIFISTGNISSEHIREMRAERHASHTYPFHFYSLDNHSDIHSCESTNICPPGESMNNVTVGAIADNFGNDYGVGITPAKELPAYYSRKFHIDYNQQINGTDFTKFHKNKYLNKPDIVFNGGDVFEQDAGIEVLTSPTADRDKYFSRSAGTSLATPLVTSMAAEILKAYPGLHVQTVKAILINTAETPCGNNPVLFRDSSLQGVLKKLLGFGMPQPESLVFSSENAVTFVIEDTSSLDELKTIDIHIPRGLLRDKNKLCFTATLCYSFSPIRENHLNYCPLQIVFGFFKPSTPKVLANDKVEKYQIKKGLSWSEDTWAPEGRLYSNVQQLYFHLSQDNLRSIGYTTTLGIKGTGKKEIDETSREKLKRDKHRFSLVINITEVPENNASGDLYNQITAINTVQNILSADIDLQADIE